MPNVSPFAALMRPGVQPSKSSDVMLRIFITFLETRSQEAALQNPANKDAAAKLQGRCASLIEDLSDPGKVNPTWDKADQIERELLLLQSGECLLQAVRDLLDRADTERNPEAVSLRKSFEAVLPLVTSPDKPPTYKQGSDGLLVHLALKILEKVQWEQAKRFKAAPLKMHAVHRLVGSGLAMFGLFILPYLYGDLAPLLQTQPHAHDWTWLPLWTALTAGLLGAFFSRLLAVQKDIATMTLDDVETVGAWYNILLRGAVGMLGSLIVFFFLQSNIMKGSLFPGFAGMGLQNAAGDKAVGAHLMLAVPTADLAMLVVWSLIAGFSERLVPNILAKTETQLDSAATSAGTATTAPAR